MPRAFSIHIGLNILSDYYRNTRFEPLNSCVRDMEAMYYLAGNKFEKLPLSNADATRKAVIDSIKRYTIEPNKLKKGDILLITYSGHGAIRDTNSSDNYQDESWCLYDGQLWDDELFDLWTEFDAGVRILVISDSCHSGTIVDYFALPFTKPVMLLLKIADFDFKAFENEIFAAKGFNFALLDEEALANNRKILRDNNITLDSLSEIPFAETKIRGLPSALLNAIYIDNKTEINKARLGARKRLEDKLINSNKKKVSELVKASIISISACQDNEVTPDGFFTPILLDVWNNDKTFKNYPEFQSKIAIKVTSSIKTQHPNYNQHNAENFEKQFPFTVDAPANGFLLQLLNFFGFLD